MSCATLKRPRGSMARRNAEGGAISPSRFAIATTLRLEPAPGSCGAREELRAALDRRRGRSLLARALGSDEPCWLARFPAFATSGFRRAGFARAAGDRFCFTLRSKASVAVLSASISRVKALTLSGFVAALRSSARRAWIGSCAATGASFDGDSDGLDRLQAGSSPRPLCASRRNLRR